MIEGEREREREIDGMDGDGWMDRWMRGGEVDGMDGINGRVEKRIEVCDDEGGAL